MAHAHGARSVRLNQLLRIARAVNSTLEPGAVLQTIVDTVCEETDWTMACISMVDEAAQRVVVVAQRGFRDYSGSAPGWPLASSFIPRVVGSGQTLVVPDALKQTDFPSVKEASPLRGYRSALMSPLHHVDPPAVLWLCRERPSRFSAEEIAFVEAVADQAALAIRNATSYQRARSRSEELTRANETLGTMLEMALADRAPADLRRAVEAVIGNPLRFEDGSGGLLVGGPASRRSGAQTGVMRWSEGSRNLLAVPVTAGSDHFGWLVARDDNRAFSDLDLRVLQYAALVFCVTFLQDRARHEVETRLRTDLFISLLTHAEPGADEQLQHRARALHVELPLPARVCLLEPSLAGRGKDGLATLTTAALTLVARRFPNRLVAVQDEYVALLLHPDELPRATEVAEELARALPGSRPQVAAGDPVERRMDYLDSFRSAEKLIHLARFSGIQSPVLRSEDFGIYALLFDGQRVRDMETFRDRVLGRLLEVDRRGILWAKLEGLCANAFNLEATARALAVHITTLRYRRERIREVCDLDWHDMSQRLQLEVAVTIERWRRHGQG